MGRVREQSQTYVVIGATVRTMHYFHVYGACIEGRQSMRQ